ncbi:MAG: TldD/PmbA family protein [bacterium]
MGEATNSVAERLLDLARGVCEEAEVFYMNSDETPAKFEANRLKRLSTTNSQGVALRAIRGGRVGFAASSNLDDLRRVLDNAVESSEFGDEAKFSFPSGGEVEGVRVFDDEVAKIAPEELVGVGNEIIEIFRSFNGDILGEVEAEKSVISVRILNSRGRDISYEKTVYSVGANANLVRGTDILDVYDEEGRCDRSIDHRKLANRIIEKVRLAQKIVSAHTKNMPVVFSPSGLFAALIPLQTALNGRVVLQGASPLGNKVGEKVFDERVSIYDDGTLDFVLRSAGCDDEGVPVTRRALIERGVLMGFIYDLETAGRAGAESTGNGFRNFNVGSKPSPSFTNVVFDAGDVPYKDMISSIEEGIIVEQVMGAGQGNPLSGEFSVNVHLGYKIEGGEIVGRVKDTMVAGNILELLNNRIEGISRERLWFRGSMLLPYVHFGSVGVASKS